MDNFDINILKTKNLSLELNNNYKNISNNLIVNSNIKAKIILNKNIDIELKYQYPLNMSILKDSILLKNKKNYISFNCCLKF